MSDTQVVTGDLIQCVMYGMVARKLALEINTGLKSRHQIMVGDQLLTPMLAARAICGTDKRTKRGVLRDYVAWWSVQFRTITGKEWEQGDSISRALVKPAK